MVMYTIPAPILESLHLFKIKHSSILYKAGWGGIYISGDETMTPDHCLVVRAFVLTTPPLPKSNKQKTHPPNNEYSVLCWGFTTRRRDVILQFITVIKEASCVVPVTNRYSNCFAIFTPGFEAASV